MNLKIILVIKDLIKITTILKEELYNKNFRYTYKLRMEQDIHLGYHQKKLKTINIEELVKERYPKN